MLQSFVLGHVVYSFCAPIALAEAMRPAIAHRPWLGRRGIAVATALWLLVAAPSSPTRDDRAPRRSPELAVTLVAVAALVVPPSRRPRRAPIANERRGSHHARRSFVAASVHAIAPETWIGVAIAALVAAASGWLLARAARGRDWGLDHVAAVATGALLSRGVLAFFYYPVVGETPAGTKYAHNVVMLLIVAAAGAYAIRRAQRGVAVQPCG